MRDQPPEARPQGTGLLRSRLAEGKRVAAAATVLTLLLVLAKGLVGYLRHSPALTADAVHSAADTLAIFASWVGLKLAERPATKRFPFGLYRAETLASLLVSGVILLAGIGLLIHSVSGLVQSRGPLHHSVDVLVVALLSAILSLGISWWEKRVGTRIGSQSLLANADESRADVLTSVAVFLGAGATYVGVPSAELAVTALLSLLIIWLGSKHGRGAIYALLDASLDPELERRAAEVAGQVPGVMKVEQLRLRRAGPFRFGMAHIHLRKSIDVTRAHEVAHKVVDAVTAAIPSIEMLTVHSEPFRPEAQNVIVPARDESDDARVSEHFGRAEFFAVATISSGAVQKTEFIRNPARREPARAGLAAIKEILKSREVDAVLTRKIGEISFHALRDHYIEVYEAPDDTVRNTLAQFASGGLRPVRAPTHASEAAGGPQQGDGQTAEG